MRVPILATLLFSLLTCAAGAAGMYVYLSHEYDLRAPSRREAAPEREIADADGAVKAADIPKDKAGALNVEKPKLDDTAAPKPDATKEEPKPAATKAANPKAEGTPFGDKPEGALTKPNEKDAKLEAAKKAAEKAKKELENLEDLDLEDMLAKRVDFSVAVSGTVTDSKGNPVSGADVYADINERFGGDGNVMMVNFSDSGEKVATSDASGAFSGTVKGKVGEKSQVTLAMRARAKGYAESKKVNVDAKNGDTKSDIKLTLQGAGSVRGRVVDLNGIGVAGVTVSLTSARSNTMEYGGEFIGMGGSGKNSAQTDSTGTYQINDVAEGSYGLQLRAPGYREKSGPRNVDVKADQVSVLDSDFVLAATTCLRAKLVGEDSKPLQGWATIELTPAAGGGTQRFNAAVGADGSLVINDPPVGDYNVVVKLWGYFDSAKTFQVFTQDQTTDMGTLTLTPNPEAGKGGKTVRIGKSTR